MLRRGEREFKGIDIVSFSDTHKIELASLTLWIALRIVSKCPRALRMCREVKNLQKPVRGGAALSQVRRHDQAGLPHPWLLPSLPSRPE